MHHVRTLVLAFATALALASGGVSAQAYPNKPV